MQTTSPPSESSAPETLVQALTRIQLDWQLRPEQMAKLLHVTTEIYAEWLRPGSAQRLSQATIPPGMMTAVSITSIQKNLARKLPDPAKQVEWLFAPHPDFGQNPPIEILSSSPENLAWVSYYLESALTKGEHGSG